MKKSTGQTVRKLEVSRTIEGAKVGKIVDIDENGRVYVEFPGGGGKPVAARTTNSVNSQLKKQQVSIGQEILLLFEDNDPCLPIVIDKLHSLVDEIIETPNLAVDLGELKDALIDGKRVTFDAKEEIVLRCGKASITLTKAGKVLIRGAYLLHRSSGVNRIKGGSVQIN